MSMMVRAFPVKGSRADVEAFAAELSGPRKEQAARFFRSYNLRVESWHLQDTPAGLWVIAVSVLDNDVEVATQRYAAATEEFNVWFKSQVLKVTGVDPNVEPMGPPTTRIFHWNDPAESQRLLD